MCFRTTATVKESTILESYSKTADALGNITLSTDPGGAIIFCIMQPEN
jgi:hypothetical protein